MIVHMKIIKSGGNLRPNRSISTRISNVNFSARSVISPDPYLETDEVGIPLFMAKKITYPENVNLLNMEELQTMIKNGPY